MKSINFRLAILVTLAIAAVAALIGYPLIPQEAFAGLGMLPFAMTGNTSVSDIIELIEKQGTDFSTWKAKQDDRFSELSKNMDELGMKANRPNMGGSAGNHNSAETKAMTGAVKALLAGQQEKANSLFHEAKAMSAGSDPDGGYVVHDLISSGMTKVMAEISPVYRLARRVPMPTGGAFEEPIDRQSAAANWVSELEARDDTATPQLGLLSIPLHEICAMPKVSQKLIDVASLDVLQWLTGKVGDAFAVKESDAFHTGNGVGKPRGILTYTTAATSDASRTWGELEHVPTGAAGAFHTTKADCLIDLVGTLKPQYRNGSVWLMNRKTLATIRKIKEATSDQYIWQPGLLAGQPDTLLGYPVFMDEDMPDIAANSLSVAFGNIAKAYTIVERPGAKFLTDPYTDKPNVRLFAYRRVGGGLNNSEALKLLKFAAA